MIVEEQLDGIRERFSDQPIFIDVEFMDTKRFNEEENYNSFYNRLLYKLKQELNYDAVIVADDNGLEFFAEKKNEVFPDIPMFFLGINSYDLALESSKQEDITGVLEKQTFKETIELAKILNPELESVVMVIDSTPSSKAEYQDMIMQESYFPELKFITIDMESMTSDEFFEYIKQFDINDMYMNLAALTFQDGEVWTYENVSKREAEVLNTPAYTTMTVGLENGMLGGHLLSHFDQGYAAADMVMRYFQGVPMEEIAFLSESPNVNMVDYNQLVKFGLDIDCLPEDTIVLNYVPTFWDMYRDYMMIAIFVFVAETIIIIALVLNVRGKRKNAKKLLEINHRINKINDELVDTIQELNLTNQELEDRIDEVDERDTKIRKMIYVDELTGLMTRYAISELIRNITSDVSGKAAILLLDIDNFKNINDGFGHSFGDEILRIIGNRFEHIIKQNIHISRFGGDEFVVAVKDYKSEETLLQLIDQVNEIFTEPMYCDNTQLILTTSIGVAKFPEHGLTFEDLLKRADVALHQSKESGKDTVTIYQMSMDVNFQEKVHFQNLLRKAFEDEELYMNFQPLFSIKEERIYGFEALIRWRSDILGQVSPFKMITEAEEMGLVVKLGEWIFKQSFAFAEMMNRGAERPIYISINVSAIQLMYSKFGKRLVDLIEEYDLKPQYVILEMTETTLINDIEVGQYIINQLRDYGFKISLDDFGTGYSSLGYLKNFAIDILKIDKSFIDHIAESSYDRFLVEAVVKIAKERSIQTVSEGVETLSQYKVLKELGCDSIQGYLFSRPLSIEDARVITDEDVLNKIQG